MHRSLTAQRIDDRVNLRRNLNRLDEHARSTTKMDAADSFTQRAVDVLTSGKVADAMNLSKEDPRLVARYKGEHPSDNDRAKIMATHAHNEFQARVGRLLWVKGRGKTLALIANREARCLWFALERHENVSRAVLDGIADQFAY